MGMTVGKLNYALCGGEAGGGGSVLIAVGGHGLLALVTEELQVRSLYY